MKLRERYRRLTLWNKLAAWGSLASILALLLAVAMLMFSDRHPAAIPQQPAEGLPLSPERPTQARQDEPANQLQSRVRQLLRFPDAAGYSRTSVAMLETLLREQTPRKLFDLLLQYDEGEVARIPESGASLTDFLHAYYRFSTNVSELEDELLTRIGGTVEVRFRAAWRIYLRYAILRFSGMSEDDIVAQGNFLNYEITWHDAELVYRELSSDDTISRQFADAFADYRRFVGTIAELQAGGRRGAA